MFKKLLVIFSILTLTSQTLATQLQKVQIKTLKLIETLNFETEEELIDYASRNGLQIEAINEDSDQFDANAFTSVVFLAKAGIGVIIVVGVVIVGGVAYLVYKSVSDDDKEESEDKDDE